MKYSRWASRLLVIVPITFVAVFLQPCVAEIPKYHLRELESNFLPAWYQGNNLAVLKSLNKVVRKLPDDQLSELDELLADEQIPNSAQVLVEARLSLLQQGLHRSLPKPSLRELVLTLENIDREISSVLDEVKDHGDELDQDDGQKSLEEYKFLIWESHVLEQKLETSIKLTEYADFVLKQKQRFDDEDIQPEQRETLNKDFLSLGQELTKTLELVSEREALIRLKRLKYAHNTLEDSQNLKDRYLATWALNTDGRLLLETLTTTKSNFANPLLNDPGLPGRISLQVQQGNDSAGEDLIKKSGLLFTGLHWWKRGRYGSGSEAYGFLKTAQAVTSDAALFPLYMPEETPVPTPRSSESPVPEVDRRHNYIWNWEYRKVTYSRNNFSRNSGTTNRTTSETQLSRFY